MKSWLPILLLIFTTFKGIAQPDKRSSIWYFGESAGLDFNGGSPQTLTNGQVVAQFRNSSILCDENGKLQLYSDGESVWNGNNKVIVGAEDLGGSSLIFNQNGVTVPHPKFPTQFYVFSIPYTTTFSVASIDYALIDLSMNGGNGGVIFTRKNLTTNVARSVIVLRHCNNRDFWVLTHEATTNVFKAYLVDENGLSTTPVLSSAGNNDFGKTGTLNNSYFMKASFNGKKVAISQPNVGTDNPYFTEIFDFDNKTGKILRQSKAYTWLSFTGGSIANDLVFSANAQYLYVSRTYQTTVPPDEVYTSELFQVDLTKDPSNSTSLTRLATRKFVRDPPQTDGPHIKAITGLQMGIDGKIYVGFNRIANLSVINNPESPGLSCNFVQDAIDLAVGADARKMGWALPSLLPPKIPDLKTNIVLKLNANACNDDLESTVTGIDLPEVPVYQWHRNGVAIANATEPTLTISQTGKYYLMVQDQNGCRTAKSNEVDYTAKTVQIAPKIAAVSPYCVGDKILGITATGDAIKWYADKKLSQFIIQNQTLTPPIDNSVAKKYIFYATQNNTGCESPPDSVEVIINSKPQFTLSSHKIPFCLTLGENLNLQLNTTEKLTYQWFFNNNLLGNQAVFVPTQYGKYNLTVTNLTGCVAQDAVEVVESCFQLYIPDVFTPNGDSFNEQFSLSGLGIESVEVKIFNRWGELIVSLPKQTFLNATLDVWDGTHEGKPAPIGTYTYLLKIRPLGATDQTLDIIKKGVILLVR